VNTRPRIALVLSAGGLRGAAHLGVLRRLAAAKVPIDVMVGTSAGAIVAGYYAAAGLTIDQLLADADVFKGRHLIAHSLSLRLPEWLRPLGRPFAGIIPRRLSQLQSGRFDRLHQGVSAIGIVCHDLTHDCPRYFATGAHGTVPLYNAVATSASIPNMFPTMPLEVDGKMCECTDGGVSDALPIAFARGPLLGATHVIASDCRSRGEAPEPAEDLVYVRPQLDDTAALRAPRESLSKAVAAGEAAMTSQALDRIAAWHASSA
jgi:predicted acylesterase/phospholipase RssA